jgi:hypothetical protein
MHALSLPITVRRAVLISLILCYVGSGCADDSTSPPAAGGAAAASAPVYNQYRLAGNGKALIGPSGEQLPISSKQVTGVIDAATPTGKFVNLNGWVALADLSGPADAVVAVSGEQSLMVKPSLDRPDVVDGYDQPGLEHTGYGMSIPLAALNCSKLRKDLKIFAVTERAAGPLTWLSDVEQIIRKACREKT